MVCKLIVFLPLQEEELLQIRPSQKQKAVWDSSVNFLYFFHMADAYPDPADQALF